MTEPAGPDVVIETDVEILTRDGVILRADVYRPDDADTHPVLLGRTCYGKGSWGAWIEPQRTAGQGYAVVINDTRGSFSSEGQFKPFFYDIDDGYDVVEWCAAQPWSSGKVGMFGSSAPGFVQLLAALARPPHLVAIAPMQTWSNFGRGCVYDPGGGLLGSTLRWALFEANLDPARRLDVHAPGYAERREAASRAMWELGRWTVHHPLTEIPGLAPEFSPYFHEWLEHPDADEFWDALDLEARYEAIDVPALHLVGWFDKFAFGSSRNYRGLADRAGSPEARRHQRIVFGPWPHSVPVQTVTGYGHYGPEAEVDVRSLVLQWYDHWLKGIESDLVRQPPVRLFVLGENRWRDADDWPLPGTRFETYYLHGVGNAQTAAGRGWLDRQPPGDEPAEAYRYDPANPAPSFTAQLPEVRPASAGSSAGREDVLVFSTPPMREDTDVIGPVSMQLWAATMAPDTDWVVRLADVDPGGSVRVLSEGMIKARYRISQRQPSPVPPGEPLKYVIELVPVANRFRLGHRIQVEVTSSAVPLYHPNLNTGGGYDEGPRGLPAIQLVFHDRDRPSHVVLPVVAGR